MASLSKRPRENPGRSWHPVSRWGEALLAADNARIGDSRALGLDEHLTWRWRWGAQAATFLHLPSESSAVRSIRIRLRSRNPALPAQFRVPRRR